MFLHSRSSLENHTRFQTKPGRFQTQKANWTKTLPIEVAHTYMASLREYPPLGLKYFNIAKKDYNKRPPLCMMARGH